MCAIVLSSGSVAAQDGAGADPDVEERTTILRAVASEDWILRAIAAARYEFQPEDAATAHALDLLRQDDDWRVRAFAVRTIARRPGAAGAIEPFFDEDPRVLRVAMLYGVEPDRERATGFVARLLRDRGFAQNILGIEMAALLREQKTSDDAATLLTAIINRMSEAQAAYLFSRLGAACGVPRPGNIRAWKQWLASSKATFIERVQPRPITDPPTRDVQPNEAPPRDAQDPADAEPLPFPVDIASITDEDFTRLVDYLEGFHLDALELVICLDASGSMGDEINAVKEGLDRLVGFMSEVTGTLRIGIVTYQNRGQQPAGVPLSPDIGQAREFLWNVTLGGGSAEPVDAALSTALQANNWSRQAQRVIVIVGDEPLADDAMRANVQSLCATARSNGFLVNAICAQPALIPDWELMGQWGGGRSLTLETTDELTGLLVTLAVGEVWGKQIQEFMRIYRECAP